MAYMQRTVVAGKTMEIEKYLCCPKPHHRKGPRVNPTSEQMERVNERNAAKTLRRLINANFREGDLHLVLTYRGTPPDPETAKDNLRRFLRKMRKLYAAAGQELKYVVTTECKAKRIHHHMVVSKADVNDIRKLWEHGILRLSVLDDSGDYHKLAAYLIKETSRSFREMPTKKRWTASRNLIRPKEKVKTVKRNRFRDPPPAEIGGYRLVHIERRADEWSGEMHQVGYYLRN
ncbi:MAG: hypothetical protein IJD13_01215 [Oscillospiraceae bacterium]|nr:hypothetical protein [Oscillospiraceae bacterium]